MWDVLSGDFDPTGQADLMLIKLIQETDKGSIIVFHDSKKAFEKLQSLLPSYLEYWKEKGYVFNAIR
jgi:superfamily II DNA/RNA helicase